MKREISLLGYYTRDVLCYWVLRRMYMSQDYVGLYYYKRLKTLYTSDII